MTKLLTEVVVVVVVVAYLQKEGEEKINSEFTKNNLKKYFERIRRPHIFLNKNTSVSIFVAIFAIFFALKTSRVQSKFFSAFSILKMLQIDIFVVQVSAKFHQFFLPKNIL